MELKDYYSEQASHARQHEDHRERMTNIILSINGVLVGLITFSNLSIWALTASVSIILLGIYGFLFAGKHYERFRYHNSIMGAIKKEMDRIQLDPKAPQKSLREIRKEGTSKHYKNFTWPIFQGRTAKKDNGDSDRQTVKQGKAKSWIARQRVHVFWEAIHVLMILIGLGLTATIITKRSINAEDKPMKIEILNSSYLRK